MRALLGTTLTVGLATLATAQGIGGSLTVTDSATEVQEHLGSTVPADIVLTDDKGQKVRLGDYFTGDRPVVLNLGYFGCPALCGAVTNGMVDALKQVEKDPNLPALVPGRDLTILTVSFDHKELEKPNLVAAKKENYLKHYGKPEAADHWHFLVGDEQNVRRLVEAVGFGFRWNQTSKAFDHRAVLIMLSPNGKITRYLYGIYFFPKTFRLAVVEASEGKVGTTLERLLLSCYGYDPETREYSRIGPLVMSAGGALTLLALGSMLFFLLRSERKEPHQPDHNDLDQDRDEVKTTPVTP
jgi:protein SCO1